MKSIQLMLAATLIPACGYGCSNSNDRQSDAQVASARLQNDRTADSLLHEAEQAERSHNYAHALEVYSYLKGFPDSSRPADLDARIKRDESKMGDNRQSD